VKLNPPTSPDDGSETPDSLGLLLRGQEPYISDHGFTARVLEALPRRRNRGWIRFWVMAAMFALGMALAVWQMPSSATILDALPHSLSSWNWNSLTVLLPVAIVLGLLVWGALVLADEER